ncbi:BolA family protein [Pantoea sp. SoEX]|uniref:BolA family protein n=1 Tax=Pantoea sp. SoEX TaxID=2576763 RepID=UPI00135C8BCC|nr:BolA/IbaG family iron-sulfur metabolism protein [Pantoea sp. SoEX]MXP51087.1 BolA/IbaG family iron-sulfur metabolism protein [Pantoea sp. SoEX]
MKENDIKTLLTTSLNLDKVYVTSENENYFKIIAIGKIFSKLNYVQKQQLIYKPLAKYISDKTIHAVSIKTYTPQEWSNNKKFINF